jgi:uncharacterized protein YdeI (YjbR/CyaY-like superfamily)
MDLHHPTLYVSERPQWRAWLTANHRASREIWLVYDKKKPRLAYDAAVEEALCFGWIDGTVKALDKDRFIQRFAPKLPGSPWSTLNIRRAKRLIEQGRMTPAGLTCFQAFSNSKLVPAPKPSPSPVSTLVARKPAPAAHPLAAPKAAAPAALEEGGAESSLVPPDFMKALQEQGAAWKTYQTLGAGHRMQYLRWIESAKKTDIRRDRVRKAAVLIARGQKSPFL